MTSSYDLQTRSTTRMTPRSHVGQASMLQRKCACGGAPGVTGECAACRQKRLQRQATGWAELPAAPSIVHQVLRSPGQPLDPATRATMEPRFRHQFSRVRVQAPPLQMSSADLLIGSPTDIHEREADQTAERAITSGRHAAPLGESAVDFSQVRIHTDSRAAESARAVNALAYTVGPNIVFDMGQYAPQTSAGRRLLAHELTHVVQQASGVTYGVQRDETPRPRPAPVDADAQRIIDLAQDSSRPIDERAVAVVQAIINQYYPSDASKISRITYRADEQGLHITYTGRGSSITGRLEVGRYFVENTTRRHFARRVLQVRHEIEHVEQQRSGMGGESRQDEREFAAFYHEALGVEPSGTGRVQHSTRVQLIDAALGYYYCLSADLQRDNTTRRDELVTRRAEAVRASGRSDLGAAPTTCRRQSH